MKNFIFISPNFPSTYWRFCIALRDCGFNVLGIGDCPWFELSDEVKEALTEYYFCYDLSKDEELIQAISYFQEKYGKIDHLESNNEFWLEQDAKMRTIFGITTGPDLETIKNYKQKSLEKYFYERAGVKAARWTLDTSFEKVEAFANEVGYPIFAKPDNGVGAQNTFKIKNIGDLQAFFKEKDPHKPYIVEEFIDGQIISFDGITNSNAEPIFYTHHVFINDNSTIVHEKLDDLYYCVPTNLVPKDVVEAGVKTLKAFDVKNRFFHLEFFRLNVDHPSLGPKGTVVALEANMRPAGGYTPDLINFANSVNCYNIYAQSIAYDENREFMNYDKFYAAAISRRDELHYEHEFKEVLKKYKNNICFYGRYPKAISDDMGNDFIFAKFKTFDEMLEFDKFARGKKGE